MLKWMRNWGRAGAGTVLFPLGMGFRLRSSLLHRLPLLSIFCDSKKITIIIRDCSQSNKNVCTQVLLTWDDTCLLKVIQRLKHIKERHFLAFSVQDFISPLSYKSLILDSDFNRFLTRINSFFILRPFEGFFCVLPNLRDQDVSHRFNVVVAIISPGCFVATRVGVIVEPSSAKPDPGVTAATAIFVVSNYTNSCFGGVAIGTNCVESFLFTVGL